MEPSDSFGNATTPRKDQCNAETIIENIEEFLKGNASVQSVSCQTNVKAVRLVETQTGRYGGGHYSYRPVARHNPNMTGYNSPSSGGDINFDKISKTTDVQSPGKGIDIPFHISDNSTEDYDDFQTVLRKRTKRFFIAGYH